MTALIRHLGSHAIALTIGAGGLALLALETIGCVFRGRPRWRLFLQHILDIGARSQPVVIITGGFTGAVFAAQTFFQFNKVGMESAVGAIVSIAMCRELGPVLSGLMVAGRVGAAMSAEIGTMKVTEQIDALRALGVHPVDFLVVPRALAMMVSMPLLVGECSALGILAGYVVGVELLRIPSAYFINNMMHFTSWSDVATGCIKGFVFGLLIVFIACRQGLLAKDGAVGVGRATTEAVVISSLAILIANFFLTMGLNIFLPVI